MQPSVAPFISTLFVTNIHCPSCVSYAQDVLRPVQGIYNIDVSTVEHRIHVQHEGSDLGTAIAEDLIQAAFEVHHFTTTDANKNVIIDKDITTGKSQDKRLPSWHFFMSNAQRKHIDNCNACRVEMAHNSKKRRTWASLKRGARAIVPQKIKPNDELSTSTITQMVIDKERPDAIQVDGIGEQEVNAPKMYTAAISIGGMTCASCSGAITKELESLNIVHEVNVDLLSNNATVSFAGPEGNTDAIIEAVEDIGYEANLISVKRVSKSSTADSGSIVSIKYKTSFSIEGMTCGSCVGTITRGVQELPFVSAVHVDLVGNSAVIEYEGKDRLAEIIEKIEDMGYDASVVSTDIIGTPHQQIEKKKERTIQILVDGMFCEHCPSNILSALQKEFHDTIIISQSLSLKEPKLRVTYVPDPPQLTARHVIATINSSHSAFSASVYHPPSQEDRSRAMKHREQKHILFRLLFTFVIAIPTFTIGIVYMSLVPKSNKTKMWFMQPIWAGDVTREEWALFVMTTPVMFYGADVFHKRSFKELRSLWRPRSRTPILRRFYRFGSMNLLISAGTSVAYFSSLAVLIMDATSKPGQSGRPSDTYFDSVTFLTFFILIGRFLEAYSKAKTGDAVALLTKLRPSEALLVENAKENGENQTTRTISVDLLELGDTVSVPFGRSPPTDGIVQQEGTFQFDESPLTGESKPVQKASGDKVFAGTVNVFQPVKIVVTDIGGTSMLDQIVDVVRKGQSKRAPIERVADLLTGYFVPAITLIAIATWLIWLGLGVSGALPGKWLDVKQGGWPFWSLEFAIAVFVVACPCGIGLAAPTALYVGGGLAAKHGILVQGGGEAFQEASKLDIVVFDKTGTLTEGQMRVTECENLDSGRADPETQATRFALSKALEEASTHPIAKAIADFSAERLQELPNVQIETADITEIPGQGMKGVFSIKIDSEDGRTDLAPEKYEAAIGNQRLLSSVARNSDETTDLGFYIEPLLSKYQNMGHSTSMFAIRRLSTNFTTEDGSDESTLVTKSSGVDTAETNHDTTPPCTPALLFAISDLLRPTTAAVLHTLQHEHHLEVHMCTGDNVTTARAIASQAGIPATNIRAGVLPQDKAAYITELQQGPAGERRIVAFVGDGTNDTPALSAADVSIALASGSDVAVGTASFILLNSDLDTILELVRLARRVFRRVKMNFAWAGIYNVCLIPIAAGVTYPAGQWRLGPVWASAAMAASSVSVVLSSLALRIEVRSVLGRTWWKKRD